MAKETPKILLNRQVFVKEMNIRFKSRLMALPGNILFFGLPAFFILIFVFPPAAFAVLALLLLIVGYDALIPALCRNKVRDGDFYFDTCKLTYVMYKYNPAMRNLMGRRTSSASYTLKLEFDGGQKRKYTLGEDVPNHPKYTELKYANLHPLFDTTLRQLEKDDTCYLLTVELFGKKRILDVFDAKYYTPDSTEYDSLRSKFYPKGNR